MPIPWQAVEMEHFRVLQTWKKYDGMLSWGRGQCLAILDDGCDLSVPEWNEKLPWGNKVVAGYNSIDHNDDPSPVPPGYHGRPWAIPPHSITRGDAEWPITTKSSRFAVSPSSISDRMNLKQWRMRCNG